MSADRQREIPIRLVVGVALLVVGATWVAAVSFGSYPWLAIAFGVLLLGLSWRLWRLQQNQTVVVISRSTRWPSSSWASGSGPLIS